MKQLITIIFCLVIGRDCLGVESVITTRPESPNDTRYEHAELVLRHLLRATADQYGPAELKYASEVMSRDRALYELIKGDSIQVAVESAKSDWADNLIPIYIPVNKGITGYRVFLISKDSQAYLSQITNLDELKKIKMGSGTQWSTTIVMKEAGFNVITANKLEGLFWMLMGDRFQTFARGINEAPAELASRRHLFPDMRIEETIALYIPLPTFFFVSPKHPKLAERIKTGLEVMIEDGTFDDIFFEYHLKMIEDAKLEKRKVFPIPNNTLPAQVPLNIRAYWYQPGDEHAYIKKIRTQTTMRQL